MREYRREANAGNPSLCNGCSSDSSSSASTHLLSSMLRLTSVALFSLLLIASVSSGANARTRSPNVILIMADDFGYECITANGGESYKTPNIDRLAATGMRFEQCHVQPLCTPTRVQL